MRIPRRRTRPATAIEAFWAWWAVARPEIESAIASGDWPDALVAEVASRVNAINPALAWEFGAGIAAQHVLVVTSAGDRSLRAIAERWRRAGPPADETFEFATARQPNLVAFDAKLSLDGRTLALSDLRYGYELRPERAEIDVQVWHPGFRELPEPDRTKIAFLSLDWLLGEDGVEIWIGEVSTDAGPHHPPGVVEPAELALAVADLAARFRTPTWALLSGSAGGRRVVAKVSVPLKAARWPHLDTHLAVRIPYQRTDENGLPAGSSATALDELEGRINEFLDGACLVAHVSSGGVRVLHLYADGDVPAAAIRPLLDSWPEGRTKVTATPDPRWENVRHLRP